MDYEDQHVDNKQRQTNSIRLNPSFFFKPWIFYVWAHWSVPCIVIRSDSGQNIQKKKKTLGVRSRGQGVSWLLWTGLRWYNERLSREVSPQTAQSKTIWHASKAAAFWCKMVYTLSLYLAKMENLRFKDLQSHRQFQFDLNKAGSKGHKIAIQDCRSCLVKLSIETSWSMS